MAKRKEALADAARRFGPLVLRMLGVVALSVGVLGAGVAGWRWATTAERFGLQQLELRGAEHATEAELRRLAGLSPGRNLLELDLDAAEQALATHPWVSRVSLKRELPSRLLLVVEERRAAAVLALGELYLVDAAGEPFKRVTGGDELSLPLITGIDRDDFLGDRPRVLKTLARTVELIDAYHRLGEGGGELSEAHLELDEVTLVTRDGEEVRLGAGELEAKLERLARVRAELRSRSLKAEVIHLDNRARPAWVAVRLAGGPAGAGSGVGTGGKGGRP